ncbi:MAG: hypothetical protein KY454_09295 [Actinobacteria bacterium]|nr:hypothetical protein [Actinomycetota bacterium]
MTPEELGALGHRFTRQARQAAAAGDDEGAQALRECAAIARAEARRRREQVT